MTTLKKTVELGGDDLGPIDLTRSSGALASYEGGWVLDAHRPSLTARLGYNASPLFGLAHHAETWTSDSRTEESHRVACALDDLRHRWAQRHADDALGRWLASIDAPTPEDAPCQPVPTARLSTYIVASMLDQYADQVERIEDQVGKWVTQLRQQYPDQFEATRGSGLDVHLDFRAAGSVTRLMNERHRWGLDFSSPSPNRIAFHFNLAFREPALTRFCEQFGRLVRSLDSVENQRHQPARLHWSDPTSSFEFVQRMAMLRLRSRSSRVAADQSMVAPYLEAVLALSGHDHLRAIIVEPAIYPKYRQQILDLQHEVYEPARQSPPEEFDAVFESGRPVAILLLDGERIAGMGLAGPLLLFPDVRGVATDPFRDDPNVLYMVDVTVLPEYRGGLGRWIKNGVALRALEMGYSAIHGRNRDRVARGMWAINLSLGSYELQHLANDYPDSGPYRDCLYYRCPLAWPGAIDPHALTPETIARRINDDLA